MIQDGFPTSGNVNPTSVSTPRGGRLGSGFTWTIGTLPFDTTVEIQFQVQAHADNPEAEVNESSSWDHLNRVTVTADEIGDPIVNEESTTVSSPAL